MPDKTKDHNEDWGLTLSGEEWDAMEESFDCWAEEERAKKQAAKKSAASPAAPSPPAAAIRE